MELIFCLSAMTNFLTSKNTCERQSEWSGVFTSQIGDSICYSSVLLFMSTELNDGVDYLVVWERVKMF